MKAKSVKRVYGVGHAKWYDTSKKLWDRLVSKKANHELIQFFKKEIHKNTSILELGCGTGVNLERISALNLEFKDYLALDFSPDMLAIAKGKFGNQPNVQFKQQNITQLDKIKGPFDVIISTWVLSHLDNPAEVINRAQSLLTKNGKMFLITFSKPKWFIHFWLYPLSKIFFACEPVEQSKIKKIKNIKKIRSYALGITTIVLIEKS
ncbi:MAG: class I SAM-dependent methyltransferase [Candidatus Peregrinibacteria bacterium]|nr:class I SAM-dependent methyltransferase [Candidatus Peregrinibacteria bacterium]